MFTLTLCRSKYYKVKRGQTKKDISNTFLCPVIGDVFEGALVEISPYPYKKYTVKVGEDYSDIARCFGVEECALRTLNGDKTLFPASRVFVPNDGDAIKNRAHDI